MMTEFISLFTDEELLDLYQMNAEEILVCRRNPSIPNGLKAVQLRLDRKHIMDEIDNRLSPSYTWELEEIKKGLVEFHGIKPGNRYRHIVIKALSIDIVDDTTCAGPVWSVRVFITKLYSCRMIIKTSTILEHFKLISENEA